MYKITIEKVTQTEYPKTETKYFNEETGKQEEYKYNEDQNREEFKTGEILMREETETIYTQRIDEIDLTSIIDAVNS